MKYLCVAPLPRAALLSAAAFATALSSLTLGSVANAQQAQQQRDEVIVTARKRAETVKDVPATVTVYTEEKIERSGINRAGEIALLTPGVSMVDAAEVGDTQVNIRGMNGARDAENSYALVIDGVTYTNPAALNREYANLQQIEILKGPQGAIYGRNASAGAFIINTRLPDDDTEGYIKTSAGQHQTFSLNTAYGGRLGDNLLGSIQVDYFDTDGFYSNDFLGRDDVVDNQEIWSFAGRLMFELGENTTLDTKLRYGEVDASSITFNSVFHIPGIATAFVAPPFYEDANDHQNRFFSNIIHNNDQKSRELSVKLDHEMDWATLTAWGLYSDIENRLGADGTSAAFGFFFADPACMSTTAALTGFPINPPQSIAATPAASVFGAYTPTTCDGTQFQRRNQKDYSFEVRLTSNGDGPIQWMGGLYYLNIDREVAVSTGVDNLNAPGYVGATVLQTPYTTNPANPTEQLVWDQFDTDVYSVFGQVAWDLNDYITADLALRYDREERKVTNLVPTVADGAVSSFINPCGAGFTPGVDTPLNPGLCNGPIRPKETDFDQWQPKFSLKWDATDNTTLFASAGLGFRSGGFNNQGSAATVDTFINNALYNAADTIGAPTGLCDPTVAGCIQSGRSSVDIRDRYRKEISHAYEAGFKSEQLDGALRLEGAAYYTKVADMQFFEFIVGPFGLLRVVENIDEVEIRGFELGANWDAAEWLDLYAGMNANRSDIKENRARPDTVGNDSPYTPRFTANAGAYMSFPMGDDMSFFTNLDVSMTGKTWFHVVQGQTRPIGFEVIFAPLLMTLTPGEYSVAERKRFTLANLRMGVETDKWTAALWVDNLTKEDYLEEIIPAPEFGGSFIHPGSERRIGGEVSYRF